MGKTLVVCTAEDSHGNQAPCTFEVEVACGRQLRGDCSQDGLLDIADAICVLGALFLSRSPAFPCGDGQATHAGNLALLDWQLDGALDLSDAVGSLRFLFDRGAPQAHVAPGQDTEGGIALPDCPVSRGCR